MSGGKNWNIKGASDISRLLAAKKIAVRPGATHATAPKTTILGQLCYTVCHLVNSAYSLLSAEKRKNQLPYRYCEETSSSSAKQ